ncbi:MAG: hypothetical protein JXA19_07375 [Anaerolineales bacterium]|nr:hypothetical protein [Anaerolineales bacterium]
MDAVDLSITHDLGYYFFNRMYAQSPGYTYFDMVIRAEPTQKHFDPERIFVNAYEDGSVRNLILGHPWRYEKSLNICPGLITAEDAKHKKVQAFSFGGIMRIQPTDEYTGFTLKSNAPILSLTDTGPFPLFFPRKESIQFQLTNEMVSLFSILRSNYIKHLDDFYAKITEMSPINLYAASLLTLQENGESNKSEYNNKALLYRFVNNEIANLKRISLWPETAVSLEMIV